MQKFKYIKAILRCFFDRKIYLEAYNNWFGRGLKYLFILNAFIVGFTLINWLVFVNSNDSKEIASDVLDILPFAPDLTFDENITRFINIASQVPDLKFVDGNLVMQEKSPYYIKDPYDDKTIMIIDTDDKIVSLKNEEAEFLFNKKNIIIKESKEFERVKSFKTLADNLPLNNILSVVAQIPDVKIENGFMELPKDIKMISLYDKDTKKVKTLALFSDNKSLINEVKPRLVFSSIELTYLDEDGKILSITPYKNIDREFTIKKITKIVNYSKIIMSVIFPILFGPFIIIVSFALLTMFVLIYSLITYAFMKHYNLKDFNFSKAMRVTALAITPTEILKMVLPEIIDSQWLIYLSINLIYIYFATNYIKRQYS